MSPSSNQIKSLILKRTKIDQEMFKTIAKKRKREEDPFDEDFDSKNISEETKQHVIRENTLLARRGISPCTEKEMSIFKSGKRMKATTKKKKRHRLGNGKLTLLDIHNQFDSIHCLTTIMIEPIILTQKGKKPNYEEDDLLGV